MSEILNNLLCMFIGRCIPQQDDKLMNNDDNQNYPFILKSYLGVKVWTLIFNVIKLRFKFLSQRMRKRGFIKRMQPGVEYPLGLDTQKQ